MTVGGSARSSYVDHEWATIQRSFRLACEHCMPTRLNASWYAARRQSICCSSENQILLHSCSRVLLLRSPFIIGGEEVCEVVQLAFTVSPDTQTPDTRLHSKWQSLSELLCRSATLAASHMCRLNSRMAFDSWRGAAASRSAFCFRRYANRRRKSGRQRQGIVRRREPPYCQAMQGGPDASLTRAAHRGQTRMRRAGHAPA